MTTLNEITYVDWQYKLNSIGEVAQGVEDINQCILYKFTQGIEDSKKSL